MYKLLKLNLARNALRYIIKTYNIKELYIPYYLCNVIRKAAIQEKCKPIFYHIDDNFYPCEIFKENAFILYPDYFGICDNNVKKLSAKYKNLIVDNAHSFYSEPRGLACFNSARKFLPVYNGSYLWIKNDNLKFENEIKYNSFPKNENEIEINEINFQKSEILFINKKIEDEILKFDNNERIKLFFNLHKKYKDINFLNIDIDSIISPFCYPILLDNYQKADNLVKKLNNDGLTIYRYWEQLPKNFNEYKFYERLVCIPLM